MTFGIMIRFDGRRIRLQAEQVYLSTQLEKYRVTARNKSLTLQNNRPLLKAKGLKNKKTDWKLIDGQMHNTHVLGEIIKALEGYLKMQENKSPGYR
jgi:hypothetical protein